MRVFLGLEEWGRSRAMQMLSSVMPASPVDSRTVGKLLRQNPAPKILLVGIYQKMGQFLCTTPLIRSLATAWPHATIHFMGSPVNAAAARANPHLDQVWVWNKSALLEWAQQLRALRQEQFDLTILLTTERPSATGVLIGRAIGAQYLAGYVPSISGQWAKNTAALCHISIPSRGETNEVEKFLGIGLAFGIEPVGRAPEFRLSPADESAVETFLKAQKFSGTGPLVGLFIGGKTERSDRLWPVAHFVRLAQTLEQRGFRVIVISPPPPTNGATSAVLSAEHLRLEEFRRSLDGTPVFQEASIGRVAAFIKRLDLLVCPDGGILHLAAAVGTPTLGLFFSTDPDVWRHDLRQTVLDGRGKPSSEMDPTVVAAEVFRFLQTSATR